MREIVLRRAGLRARVGLVLACAVWLSACGDGGDTPKEPADEADAAVPFSDCSGEGCPSLSPPTDWAAAEPTFEVRVMVHDAEGKPVSGAGVLVTNRYGETDENGFVRVGPIPAKTPKPMTVTKEGATPYLAQTTVNESGDQIKHVTLLQVGVKADFEPSKPASIAHGKARVELPAKALIKPDGTRPVKAKAELTYMAPEAVPAEALPASSEAYDEAGRPTAMKALLGVMYAHFTAEDGSKLNVAPGQVAVLVAPLPKGSAFEDGTKLPMWSLDETTHSWRKEQSCTVSKRSIEGETESYCVGRASHFSIYAWSEEVDVYDPQNLGCVNAAVRWDQTSCYQIQVLGWERLKCDQNGENCRSGDGPYSYVTERGTYSMRTLAYASISGQPGLCEVLGDPTKEGTFRFGLKLNVDTSACAATDDAPEPGRRFWASGAVSMQQTFEEALDLDLNRVINFYVDGERDCQTSLCSQVALTLTREDLDNALIWVDHDGDGTYRSSDPSAASPYGTFRLQDCDDDDRRVRPYAFEPPCSPVDLNCDGRIGDPKPPATREALDFGTWNAYCAACRSIWLENDPASMALYGEEASSNNYDEDCDGLVWDADEDGYLAFPYDPDTWAQIQSDRGTNTPYPSADVLGDCDDLNPAANPGLSELPGNEVDENCDGYALDRDADGFPASWHVGVETSDFAWEDFRDCDDFDGAVNPSAPASAEAGQIALLYYTEGEDVRRDFLFCSLYDSQGRLGGLLYNTLVTDFNCDGEVTDPDGDGVLPADDCDDMDPRVGAPVTVDGAPMCTADSGMLLNDSECTTGEPYVPGTSCPTLRANRVDLPTACEEAKDVDGNGTGAGVCSFAGWWEGNPLTINAGAMWGPCDGLPGAPTNQLPDCPAGSVCGGLPGGNPWTPAFENYVRQAYTDGTMELTFKGMCFPGCIVSP